MWETHRRDGREPSQPFTKAYLAALEVIDALSRAATAARAIDSPPLPEGATLLWGPDSHDLLWEVIWASAWYREFRKSYAATWPEFVGAVHPQGFTFHRRRYLSAFNAMHEETGGFLVRVASVGVGGGDAGSHRARSLGAGAIGLFENPFILMSGPSLNPHVDVSRVVQVLREAPILLDLRLELALEFATVHRRMQDLRKPVDDLSTLAGRLGDVPGVRVVERGWCTTRPFSNFVYPDGAPVVDIGSLAKELGRDFVPFQTINSHKWKETPKKVSGRVLYSIEEVMEFLRKRPMKDNGRAARQGLRRRTGIR